MKKSREWTVGYILPNLFTAASIFTGILSIVATMHSHFEKAAWLIFLSLLFDGLDGRIARLTRTTSRFGMEFDSLADVVAFGTAPALLLYAYVGEEYGRFGVLAAALFVIFGSVRLARFNVIAPTSDPGVFIGVPIPIAAVFVAVWVLMFLRYDTLRQEGWILLVGAIFVAFLMVSHIRYPSFKKITLEKGVVTKTLVAMIAVASLLYLFPVEGFAFLISFYLIWGMVRAVYALTRRRFRRLI